MKKILLSLIMLCTMVSAWSLTTTTVTIKCSDVNPLGIVYCDAFMAGGPIDDATKKWQNKLEIIHIGSSCVITSVEFVMSSGSIDKCESTNGKWKVDATGKWEQDGTFAYDEDIAFSSTSSCLIEKVTITYHKHTFTHHEAEAATCMATGMQEYWECNDCRHIYLDKNGTQETDMASLVTDIDPTNHAGNLTEVAFKNASVIEEGIYHHWHCGACGNDYADVDGKENMNGKTVMAKYDADAILIGMNEGMDIDDSFILLPSTEETVTVATVTFDEDDTMILDIAGKGGEKTLYSISEEKPLVTSFSRTFKLKANKDPETTSDYYSTFFTSEGAYKVSATATAYIGSVVDKDGDTDVLKLAGVGKIIHQSEAVILKATGSDITLMPSCSKTAASTENVLLGTDEATTLSANQYALSLGGNGVGFYLWEGKEIGANKAYLELPASSVKAFTFEFEEATGIQEASPKSSPEGKDLYNLNGVRVNENYKGIVIKNGKKVLQK